MANYYVLLTDYGRKCMAKAQANQQLELTHVVLGDANHQPYLPDSRLAETSLVNQTAQLPISTVKVINDDTAEVSCLIPTQVGGFNLHEVGITDSTGKIVYLGNFHGGYRPSLTEGAGGDMELIFEIKASNLATIIIESDGTTAVASKEWVSKTIRDEMTKSHQLLAELLFPIGYPYWSHIDQNPKVGMDKLFGYETHWRKLEGVHLVAVDESSSNIYLPMLHVGNDGTVTTSHPPTQYHGYAKHCWERYDPDFDYPRYDGTVKADGKTKTI